MCFIHFESEMDLGWTETSEIGKLSEPGASRFQQQQQPHILYRKLYSANDGRLEFEKFKSDKRKSSPSILTNDSSIGAQVQQKTNKPPHSNIELSKSVFVYGCLHASTV